MKKGLRKFWPSYKQENSDNGGKIKTVTSRRPIFQVFKKLTMIEIITTVREYK